MIFTRINTVCLGVRDIVRARAFYRDGIGFSTPNNEENPAVVFFRNGGSTLELYPLDLLAKDVDEENPPPAPGGFGGVTLAYYARSEAEVDGIFSRVEALGGRVVKTPKLAPWNVYSGYFQDLDGYYWEVASCEQWLFDDRGVVVNIGEENI